jgi:thioredoxin reductase
MYEVIIIGGGIAGITASIYAARKRMGFLLITKNFGGQFTESGQILNYPGMVKTDGLEFSKSLKKQIDFNGIKPNLNEEVKKIEEIPGRRFKVYTDKGSYESKSLIISSGSMPRKLNIPGEKEFANKGVTYCSICDGPLFSGRDIAVIGGGNSALEGVDFTKDIAGKIYLLNINKDFTAHEYLVERVTSYSNVEVIHNSEVKEIYGDALVKGLKYEKQGREYNLAVAGVIIEAGRQPVTGFAKGFVELTEQGHIKIDCQARTTRQGVFAAGDCASGQEYQYVIAAGQGCISLLKAARYLARQKI